MKLVCPSCGATASAEGWLNDAICREAMLVISRLPSPLPKTCLGYLSLFRPGKSALGWKKVLRLALEIEQLAKCGYVSVQGRPDKNCTPGIWAQAMEQMLDQRNGLSTPMPNHNYLKKVAHDLADQADYLQEKKSYVVTPTRTAQKKEKLGPVSLSKILSPMDAYIQGARDTKPTQEEMQEYARKGLE